MVQELTSTQNQHAKRMRSLYTRKGREKSGLMPVEGLRFVTEALYAAQTGVTSVEAVFYEAGFEDSMDRDVAQVIREVGREVFRCSSSVFRTLTDTETPQGIVAAVTKPTFPKQHCTARSLYLVVDRVQDPGNLGTMIRTAAAAGADAVFCLKGTVDPYNPKALRATMGSVFRIPLEFVADSRSLIESLHEQHCRLIAADVAGQQYHFEASFAGPIAIIVGNEGQGIEAALLQAADVKVRIPLAQGVESLNAAVASGILLYEAVRFRRTSNGPEG